MNSPALFDVVLFGLDLVGTEREAAKRKLADLLDITEGQVTDFLDGRGRAVVEKVSLEHAKRYRDALLDMGFRCNFRPTAFSDHSLELVPMSSEERITCPACARIHVVKEGDTPPMACERCGVVFSKYHVVAAQKEEREKIRRALLAKHQRLVDESREEQERREQEARQRQIEDEIRRELGLPRILHSRGALLSSATALFALGLGLGAAGLHFYDRYYGAAGSSGKTTVDAALTFQGLTPEMMANLDPALFAHLQFGPEDPSSPADFGPAGVADITKLANAAPAAGAPAATAISGLASGLRPAPFDSLKTDPEWDLFVLGRIDALLKSRRPADALQLIDQLKRPESRVERLAERGQRAQAAGQSVEAERLFAAALQAAAELSMDPVERIEVFASLAWLTGDSNPGKKAAEAALKQARALANGLQSPGNVAVAEANVASILARLGRAEEAKEAFQRTRNQLQTITAMDARMQILAPLARVYGRAGKRSSALMLLEDMDRELEKVADPVAKAHLLEQIVRSYGSSDEIPAALDAIDRHAGGTERDRLRYELLANALLAATPADLAAIPSGMISPTYQARAYGLLEAAAPAVSGDTPSRMWLERGRSAAAAIIDPAEKAVIFSELGRIAAHLGDITVARAGFSEAERLAEAVAGSPESSRLFALIAANQARSLAIGDAQRNLARIIDPALAKETEADIAAVARAAKVLGT